MKEVAAISIVFENLESIIVPIDRIKKINHGRLELSKLEFLEDNSYTTDRFEMIISFTDKSELDYNSSDYEEPLGMFVNNPTSNRVLDRPNILGRLIEHSDIVFIKLLDKNEKSFKNIYVPWSRENEYRNMFMSVETKNQELIIKIIEDELFNIF